jgi:hypothetical protein
MIGQLELPLRQCRAQIEFEISPCRHPVMHRGLEKPVRAAPGRLGAIERQIGVLEQLIGVDTVAGRNRNADAGIDHDLDVIEVVGQRNGVAQSPGKPLGVGWLRDPGLDDRKLVSAQSGHQVGFSDAIAQAVCDCSQQVVADRMPQGVVDILEVVEIEVEHGQSFATQDPPERFLEPLPE